MPRVDLKLDWATQKAAEYACKNWHYAGRLPSGSLVKVGAWEDGRFIGVVIFGRGTSPYLGRAYNLLQTECVELIRVALRSHKTPVSRIVAIAIKMLKKHSPGLRLIVSFAAKDAGHHGGIYQAGNWIYAGETTPQQEYLYKGKRVPTRVTGQLVKDTRLSTKTLVDKGVIVPLPTQTKHRYLMPLDDTMRDAVYHLSKPYPKQDTGGENGERVRPK